LQKHQIDLFESQEMEKDEFLYYQYTILFVLCQLLKEDRVNRRGIRIKANTGRQKERPVAVSLPSSQRPRRPESREVSMPTNGRMSQARLSVGCRSAGKLIRPRQRPIRSQRSKSRNIVHLSFLIENLAA
jgi:hypothetical protein